MLSWLTSKLSFTVFPKCICNYIITFIGIDIGKFNFVVGVHGQKETKNIIIQMQEIKEFSKDYKKYFGLFFMY